LTRVHLTDGRVLVVQERAGDLQALVDRRAPGQVGVTTASGERVLVDVAAIVRVD